jgi:hypothetical protein
MLLCIPSLNILLPSQKQRSVCFEHLAPCSHYIGLHSACMFSMQKCIVKNRLVNVIGGLIVFVKKCFFPLYNLKLSCTEKYKRATFYIKCKIRHFFLQHCTSFSISCTPLFCLMYRLFICLIRQRAIIYCKVLIFVKNQRHIHTVQQK